MVRLESKIEKQNDQHIISRRVKDLHINWLWGERYFAQHLVDYPKKIS
jgi:hypothetical protein